MPEGRSLDAILAELARATVALEEAERPTERAALRDELHRLRAEAARWRGSELGLLTDDALSARLDRCDRDLAALRGARFDPSMSAGGRGGGIDPYLAIRHNRAVDEAGGRGALAAERQAILAELARRSR